MQTRCVVCTCITHTHTHYACVVDVSVPPHQSNLSGGGVGSGGVCHYSGEEMRDVLEHFGAVFGVLEPYAFRDVFQPNMKLLFGEHTPHAHTRTPC